MVQYPYKFPKIEIYQVLKDELQRIEECGSRINFDLTMGTISLTAALSVAIPLLTNDPPINELVLIIILISSLILLVYFGERWRRSKNDLSKIISESRSRKPEPDLTPGPLTRP